MSPPRRCSTRSPLRLGQSRTLDALPGRPLRGFRTSASLPTFSFGGTPTVDIQLDRDTQPFRLPGLCHQSNPSGTLPYATGFAGTPGPLAGYCASGGPNPETGAVLRQPVGSILPMSPYYFPFVMRNPNDPNVLTGFFDYRPKDSDEAIVVANSFDNGNTWHFVDEKLELNPNVCPDGIQNDNGQGHPYVQQVSGTPGVRRAPTTSTRSTASAATRSAKACSCTSSTGPPPASTRGATRSRTCPPPRRSTPARTRTTNRPADTPPGFDNQVTEAGITTASKAVTGAQLPGKPDRRDDQRREHRQLRQPQGRPRRADRRCRHGHQLQQPQRLHAADHPLHRKNRQPPNSRAVSRSTPPDRAAISR